MYPFVGVIMLAVMFIVVFAGTVRSLYVPFSDTFTSLVALFII